MYKSTLFKIWSLIKPPKLMVEEIMYFTKIFNAN